MIPKLVEKLFETLKFRHNYGLFVYSNVSQLSVKIVLIDANFVQILPEIFQHMSFTHTENVRIKMK